MTKYNNRPEFDKLPAQQAYRQKQEEIALAKQQREKRGQLERKTVEPTVQQIPKAEIYAPIPLVAEPILPAYVPKAPNILQSATNVDSVRLMHTQGSYEFNKILGRGAQGQVWSAYKLGHYDGREVSRKEVALKLLISKEDSLGGAKEMEQEANTLMNCQHDNIIHVSGFNQYDFKALPQMVRTEVAKHAQKINVDYRNLVVPLLEMDREKGFRFGADFASWLHRLSEMSSIYSIRAKGNTKIPHLIDIQTAAYVGSRVCRALEVAHDELGIVHKDIKPANILINKRGVPKLTDFGLANVTPEAGQIVGTPYYMGPEQIMGLPLTGKADMYSVGIILYEAIMGAVPWMLDENPKNAENPLSDNMGISLRQILGRAKSGFRKTAPAGTKDTSFLRDPEECGLREINTPQGPAIKKDVCGLLRRMLDPNPDERPTAKDAAEELEGIIYGHGFGPTTNALKAHGQLYEQEPLSLRGITSAQLTDLRYTCRGAKNPKAIMEFADSFGNKPITFTKETIEFIPQIARPYIDAYSENPRSPSLNKAQTVAIKKAQNIQTKNKENIENIS